jgi:hypothetical protein
MKTYLEDIYDVDGHRFVACLDCAIMEYQFTPEFGVISEYGTGVNFSEYAVVTGLKGDTYNCSNDCEDECSCEIECESCGSVLTGEANI